MFGSDNMHVCVGLHVQLPRNTTIGIMTIIILLLLMLLFIIVIYMYSKVGGVDTYMCVNSIAPQVKRRGGSFACQHEYEPFVAINLYCTYGLKGRAGTSSG